MFYSDSVMEMAESFITLEAEIKTASLSEEMKDAIYEVKNGKKCVVDAKKYKIEHEKMKATKLGKEALSHYKKALVFAKMIPNDNAAEFVAACYTKKEITALLRKDPKGATRQTVIDLINASIVEAKIVLFPLKI